MIQFQPLDLDHLRAVLCDADGNLFPSEEPAFEASAKVTNAFLEDLGVPVRYGAEELRRATTGKNFRTTAVDLCVEHAVGVDPTLVRGRRSAGAVVLTPELLEHWVAEEDRQVRAHLGRVLRPDGEVLGPLRHLALRFELAAVSSSGTARLDICFRATELNALIPPERRFSAQDSLPTPTSKPDPAVYVHTLGELAVEPDHALAVEDSVPGARSAIAAGIPTIGNVGFVPADERAARVRALRDEGVVAIVTSWQEIAAALPTRLRVAEAGT